jgi:hypothetical protein
MGQVLEFGKPFFFSFFVSPVHEPPELFILREHHAFNVCVLGERGKAPRKDDRFW